MGGMSQTEFGIYLKKLRNEKKLSIRQLEDLSGVSNAYLSQIENGKRGIPSPDILKKLHDPLGVPYDELMEKAGHISSTVRSELIPETIKAMESHGALSELISNAADIFIGSVTEENGVLKEDYKSFLIKESKEMFSLLNDEELNEIVNNPNMLEFIFESLSFEEKIIFLNSIIKDYVERKVDLEEVFGHEITPDNRIPILKVPILGFIAAGQPIFTEEHIDEWTEVPNMWNLKLGEAIVLKVKGDSMIGSRIYEGDRVLVKIQPEVENGEIAVVNVNGEEATLKRIKKTENGQVILYPDNPKYDPTFITNENARIIGKVIQVMFEPK